MKKKISPNNPNQTENQWGRPTKIKNFIEAFEKVLEKSEEDVIYLTDEELLFTVNYELEEEHRIAESTLWKWKAWILDTEDIEKAELMSRFLLLYKKALTNQKRELMKEVRKWENNWQSRAWIIERKFDEWNLRTKVDKNVKADIHNISPEEEKLLDEIL